MKFRLGSIPVEVRWSFFFITALLAFDRIDQPSSLITWLIVVFMSVLWHELGHAMAFIAFGHSPSIELYQMGGLTRGSPGVPLSPGRHALVSLAGPFAGFLLGGAVLLVRSRASLPEDSLPIVRDLIWANIAWGVFNLLPIWPFDGGQALVGVLRVIMPRRGELIGLGISCVTTAALVVVALAAGQMYLAFIAGWFGSNGFVRLRWIWSRGGDGVHQAKLEQTMQLIAANRLTEAVTLANELVATGSEQVRRDAKQLLAASYLAMSDPKSALSALDGDTSNPVLLGSILMRIEGRQKEGEELLRKLQHAAADTPEMVAAKLTAGDLDGALAFVESHDCNDQAYAMVEVALFRAERFEQALAISRRRFEKFGSPHAAYNAACSLARLGRTEEAIRSLRDAARAGMDLGTIAADEDLASLRDHPEFEALLRSERSL